MRYLRALAAALTLTGVVAGIPVLLWLTVGNPLAAWPDLAAGDLSDTALIGVLAAVAYLAWAQFAVTVLLEILTAVTRVRLPDHLPLAWSGQRRLAQALVAAAFLLQPVPPSSAAPDLPTTVATAPVLIPTAALVSVGTGQGADESATAPSARPPTYTIRADGPGTYWDLAERFLGDGQRWPEIWHLNDGRRQDNGAVMTSPGLLRPGWTVVLPAAATSDRPAARPERVTVQRGDSLWSIAETHLDDGYAWPDLFRLNKDKPQPHGGRLTDPDLIRPGWILDLPAPVDASPDPSGRDRHSAPGDAVGAHQGHCLAERDERAGDPDHGTDSLHSGVTGADHDSRTSGRRHHRRRHPAQRRQRSAAAWRLGRPAACRRDQRHGSPGLAAPPPTTPLPPPERV